MAAMTIGTDPVGDILEPGNARSRLSVARGAAWSRAAATDLPEGETETGCQDAGQADSEEPFQAWRVAVSPGSHNTALNQASWDDQLIDSTDSR